MAKGYERQLAPYQPARVRRRIYVTFLRDLLIFAVTVVPASIGVWLLVLALTGNL